MPYHNYIAMPQLQIFEVQMKKVEEEEEKKIIVILIYIFLPYAWKGKR